MPYTMSHNLYCFPYNRLDKYLRSLVDMVHNNEYLVANMEVYRWFQLLL